jgi:hypothetical protein
MKLLGLMGWVWSFWVWWAGVDPYNSIEFMCYLYRIYVSSIALLKCVWRRLTTRFMRLGGWKGVECLALPCRLKNINYECSNLFLLTLVCFFFHY